MENNPQLSEEEAALGREAGDAGIEFLKGFGQNPAYAMLNDSLKNALFVAYCAGYRAGAKAKDTRKKLILQ